MYNHLSTTAKIWLFAALLAANDILSAPILKQEERDYVQACRAIVDSCPFWHHNEKVNGYLGHEIASRMVRHALTVDLNIEVFMYVAERLIYRADQNLPLAGMIDEDILLERIQKEVEKYDDLIERPHIVLS